MKNIHILPTDKPSRLYKHNELGFKLLAPIPHEIGQYNGSNQNIYITSDEEIKEGDYVCASGGFRFVKTLNNDKGRTFKDDGIISKQNPSSSCHLSNYKKIILTTDQDLINDGVQAIDDEFLEWFVKNPSCEEVDVKPMLSNNGRVFYGYKIIIPKEKSKQETLEEASMNWDYLSFEAGVKWKEERMYSEEDLKSAFFNGGKMKDIEEFNYWFEQFKKK